MTRCLSPACNDGPPLHDGDLERRPRLTEDGWALCRRCYDRLERHLGDLPALDDAVRAVVPHGLSAGIRLGNSPTKGSPPLPARGLDALLDHLAETQAVLRSWVVMTCEEWPGGLLGPPVGDTPTLARWLIARLDWLGQHGAAGDLCAEVDALHRTGTALTGAAQARTSSRTPCPVCGAHELSRPDGADHHDCSACGASVFPEEFDRHQTALLADLTVTADQAAALASVKPAVFRQWVTRGHVRRVGTDTPARYYRKDVTAMTEQNEGAA